jgi:hypothetical protein
MLLPHLLVLLPHLLVLLLGLHVLLLSPERVFYRTTLSVCGHSRGIPNVMSLPRLPPASGAKSHFVFQRRTSLKIKSVSATTLIRVVVIINPLALFPLLGEPMILAVPSRLITSPHPPTAFLAFGRLCPLFLHNCPTPS